MNKKIQFFMLSLTLCLLAVIIFIISYNSRPIQSSAVITTLSEPIVILDAGHGGADGGAVSVNGTEEAQINLKITRKTYDLMGFFGIPARLTREDESSLDYDESRTLKQNKVADIKARLGISNASPQSDFLSIHLNKFSQSKYYGAQVFYGLKNERSQGLAGFIQSAMRDRLDPENKRAIKPSPDTVYLMKNISVPAVTIECGFLSNEAEEAKLVSDEYQTDIAIAITKGYIDYLKEG